MGRGLFALPAAAGLLAPAPAGAADLFVGASRPGASDGGSCTTVGAPCATIQVAVDKAEGLGGGAVRVLPNPDGRTTDVYAETVVLDGVIFASGAPVTPTNAPPDYVAPVIVRRHDEGDHSITAGTAVHDPTIPALEGRFLYADFFLGATRAAVAAAGGVSADGEVEGLAAVPGVVAYNTDGCGRIHAVRLNQATAVAGKVQRLATTGQCVPPPEACTILGTGGGDRLQGTTGRDVICGLGGNDKLIGLEGDDLLAGGGGADTLIGGPGADVLQGGDGSDLADYGGTQPVAVTIGAGADDGVAGEADDVQIDVERVAGGSADDRLTAGTRHAQLLGRGGADVLTGSPENDTLKGQGGDDDLEGGDGSDALFGGDDDDRLRALDGHRDRLVCGLGLDTGEADPVDFVDASCE